MTQLTYLPIESWPKKTWDETIDHLTMPSLAFQFTKWNRKICVQATRTGERAWRCTFARWFHKLPNFQTLGKVSHLDNMWKHYRYLYRLICFTDHCHLDNNFLGDDVRVVQFTMPPSPRAIYWLSMIPNDGTLRPPENYGAVSPHGGIIRLRPHHMSIEIQQHANAMREKYLHDLTCRDLGMIRNSSGTWETKEQIAASAAFLRSKSHTL